MIFLIRLKIFIHVFYLIHDFLYLIKKNGNIFYLIHVFYSIGESTPSTSTPRGHGGRLVTTEETSESGAPNSNVDERGRAQPPTPSMCCAECTICFYVFPHFYVQFPTPHSYDAWSFLQKDKTELCLKTTE